MNEDVTVAEGTAGLSQIERVADVFLAPGTTFEDIRRSASWWLPFLLTVFATVAVTLAIQYKVGWDQVVQTQVQMNPSLQNRMSSLAPDVQQTQMRRMVMSYEYSAYAAPLLILAVAALGSLVLWSSFRFGLASDITYGQMFSVWMYSSLPHLLGALVTVIVLCFGSSPESFNLRNPIGTNLAYYLPDASSWVRALLSYFDVLGVWVLALLVMGCAIAGKVKTTAAAAVVLGWWLLVILVSVGAAAAFS